MTQANPFPKVSAFLPSLPLGLIKRLRQVVEAGSHADSFACYCNLVEWLATYLANLCNSVYKDRPTDIIDERLESVLRGLSQPLSFGTTVTGLQALSRGNFGLTTRIPELSTVISHDRLPASCVRQVRAFQVIKRAREEFAVPPSHLEKFVRTQLPDDQQVGRCTLDHFLRNLIDFRNKGVGHQDEEGWFPRDQRMYGLLNQYLAPAVDDILDWEPMRMLLTYYEVVSIENLEARVVGQNRAYTISRHNVADGFAPLGPSHVLLPHTQRVEPCAFVGRRTAIPHELESVVRFSSFPQTHQTSEQLYRRYAAVYLLAYLERGLITRPQRESDLDLTARKLAISDTERSRIEAEAQKAINLYAPDDTEHREQSLQLLAALMGQEWQQIQPRVSGLLAQLPTKRKDYIFDQIDNNAIMNFDQLLRETELSEPDLESVLADLEQEGRVRRIGTTPGDRVHAHFKAQDPTKPATFREILASIKSQANPKRRYPAFMWRLVDLCTSLLSDDGLEVPRQELDSVHPFFDDNSGTQTDGLERSSAGTITLTVDTEDIRAESVRDLYERVGAHLRRHSIDPSPAVPFLMGHTRYLVNTRPVHANGTHFAIPVNVGPLYFEANRKRDQALAEVIRFLRKLGMDATSPDLVGNEILVDDDTGDEDSVDEPNGPMLKLELRSDEEEPVTIQGSTVRRFFTELLDYLISQDADLDPILPVRAGRIRHLLADEPYHANGRRFDSAIERGGYFMNTAFSYEQALIHARAFCEQLGYEVNGSESKLSEEQDTTAPLRVNIGDESVEAVDVPAFLGASVKVLYSKQILTDSDIPYKSGRVRYLISESPTHDHGRDFIRPIEIRLGDRLYFIEANISRNGAVELIERLMASKKAPYLPDRPATEA